MTFEEITLVRHGETEDNSAGRICGLREVGLNQAGRAQAEALADELADREIAAIWTSPLRRARETAEPVAARHGLSPRTHAGLRESERGAWSGRLVADLRAEFPAEFLSFERGDPDFGFPGGETLAGHTARVRDALLEISTADLPALVVCHSGTIRAAFAAFGASLQAEADVPHAVPLELPDAARHLLDPR